MCCDGGNGSGDDVGGDDSGDDGDGGVHHHTIMSMYLSRKDSGSALRPLVLRCSNGKLAGF